MAEAVELFGSMDVDFEIKEKRGNSMENKKSSPVDPLSTVLEPEEDLILPQWPTLSAPIDIPKRKIIIKPPWVENTGWVKYQAWFARGPTY